MLRARVASGLLLGAMVIATVCFDWVWLGLVIMLTASGVGGRESYDLLRQAGVSESKRVGIVGGLIFTFVVWARYHYGWVHGADLELLVFVGMAMAVFLRQVNAMEGSRPLHAMAGTLMGFFYCSFLLSFIIRLSMGWPGHGGIELSGRALVFYMIVVTKCTDMGAFFVGCRYGKTKLCPRISPAKTWEGVIGGLGWGLSISLVFWLGALLFNGGMLGPVRLPFVHAVVLGLLLPVAGILGDLFESLMKRAAGVKDSGTTIRGMGGLLDVLDSLLLAGPVCYFYARFFLT